MATQKSCCFLIYEVTMMTVTLLGRLTVIIHLWNIQQGAQKVGKATVFSSSVIPCQVNNVNITQM